MAYLYHQVECPELVEGHWFVYLLECKDHSIYCGSSNNLTRRITEHNSGSAAQWTKLHGPAQLAYYETWDNHTAARRREMQIKRWTKVKKLKLISGEWRKNTTLAGIV